MSEADPFKVHISLLDLAKATGSWALELFRLHLLSPVSDHTFEHPLDTPSESVVTWPESAGAWIPGNVDTETMTAYERVFSGGMPGDSALNLPDRTPFS